MVRRKRSLPKRILRAALYGVVMVFFLFPIFWITMTSLKSGSEYLHSPPVWFPRSPDLTSFVHAIEVGGLTAFKNSVIVATLSTALALLIGSLAAYGLARYEVGGQHLPFFFLSQRFLPPVVVVFPFLLMFKTLRWVDTYQALIIVYLTFNLPYTIWMMRSFFSELPREIEESALVDGASPFGAFWRVAMPLAAPGLIATGIFCFIFSWSEFFFGITLTNTRATPLSVFLPSLFGKQMIMWGDVGALSVIASAPMFLLGLLVQRYLVRGLTMGAVK
ncbi:MAG TPA: carbohydrate ABC transporter permease [Caldilineaceae bacterium]|nr:carbohydrate ABC transporter permease [Caldilineaceae bacterium]